MQPGRGPFLQPSVWPIEHVKVNHDVVIIVLLLYWCLRAVIRSHHVRRFHWRIIFIAQLTCFRRLCWFRFSGSCIYRSIFSLWILAVRVSRCVMFPVFPLQVCMSCFLYCRLSCSLMLRAQMTALFYTLCLGRGVYIHWSRWVCVCVCMQC